MTPENIRILRRGLGLRQRDFASLVGIAHKTVSDWERGRKRPSVGHVTAMRALYTPRSGEGSGHISEILRAARVEELGDLEFEAEGLRKTRDRMLRLRASYLELKGIGE